MDAETDIRMGAEDGDLPIGGSVKTVPPTALGELRAILTALPSPLCVVGPGMTCLAVNRAFSTLFGLLPRQMTDLPIADRLPEPMFEQLAAMLGPFPQPGIERARSVELGEWTWHSTVTRIGPPGAPIAACIMLADITALAATERRIKQQNRDLTEQLDRTRRMAGSDALTGLPNRHGLEEALLREIASARLRCAAIGIALIDIDHFKAYNDTYGHISGDDCLAGVAQALSESVTLNGGFVGRFGGEEFVCIWPGATHAAVHQGIGLAADSVRALRIEHLASPHGIVTVSIGACWMQSLDPNIDDATLRQTLLQKADELLYAAKEAGRDTALMVDGAGHVTLGQRHGEAAPAPRGRLFADPSPGRPIPATTAHAPGGSPRRHFTIEEKLRIAITSLASPQESAALCAREAIPPAMLAAWQANVLRAARARLADQQDDAVTAPSTPAQPPSPHPPEGVLKDIIVEQLIELRSLRGHGDTIRGWSADQKLRT